MQRRRLIQLGGTIIGFAATAWILRACYGTFVNEEDQPAADQVVAALHTYNTAKGHYPMTLDALVPQYLPMLPTPRRFGLIGYAPLDDGRGCVVGYFTHRDYLKEYDCSTKTWKPVEYEESSLVKARSTQWLRGPT